MYTYKLHNMFKFLRRNTVPANPIEASAPPTPKPPALTQEELDKKYAVKSPEAPKETISIKLPGGMRTVINLNAFGNDPLLVECLLKEKPVWENLPATLPEATEKIKVVLAEIKRIQGLIDPNTDPSGNEIRKGRDIDRTGSLAALQLYVSRIRSRFGDDPIDRAKGTI